MTENSCVIIGGSSGIGAKAVEICRDKVEHVYCLSRRGTTTVSDVKTFSVDVRDYSNLSSTLCRINSITPVRTIISCVGVGFYAPLNIASEAVWQEICDTNILGLVHILSTVQQFLTQCESLVHVGSLAAYRPSSTPGNFLYTATKVAAKSIIDDFRKNMREIKRKIRVTHLSPGFTDNTDFGKNYFRYHSEEKRDIYSSFKPLSPDDVAAIAIDIIFRYSQVELSEVLVRPLEQVD